MLCAGLQYPFIEAVDIELIDFGTKPLRVGGIKVYDTTDDEVIMETAVVWGSNARVRASARHQDQRMVLLHPHRSVRLPGEAAFPISRLRVSPFQP